VTGLIVAVGAVVVCSAVAGAFYLKEKQRIRKRTIVPERPQ